MKQKDEQLRAIVEEQTLSKEKEKHDKEMEQEKEKHDKEMEKVQLRDAKIQELQAQLHDLQIIANSVSRKRVTN